MGYETRKVEAHTQEARNAIKNGIIESGFPTTVAFKNGKLIHTIRGNDSKEPALLLQKLRSQKGGESNNLEEVYLDDSS